MKPLPHRAEECEPPETRTAQAIRAVREHVAAQAAAKQNPADRAREQLPIARSHRTESASIFVVLFKGRT